MADAGLGARLIMTPSRTGVPFVLLTAWVAALIVALVDAGAATLIEGGGFSLFHALLLPTAVMFATTWTALVVLATLAAHTARAFGGDARAGCIATVAGAAGLRVLWSLQSIAVGGPAIELWSAGVLTGITVTVSVCMYRAFRLRLTDDRSDSARRDGDPTKWLVAPVLLFCAVAWLALRAADLGTWWWSLLLAVAAVSCLGLARRPGPQSLPAQSQEHARGSRRAAVAMCVNVVIGAAILLAPAIQWRYAIMPELDTGVRNVPGPRTILLLVVDTLRPDYLSCYGSSNPTPNIDALVADGVRFDRATSPGPWTVPAMSSILTGVAPDVHRALYADSTLPPELPTLAARLHEAGYTTAAFGYNPFLAASPSFTRGFQHVRLMLPAPATYSGYLASRLFPSLYVTRAASEKITDSALTWIDARRNAPLFLWVHYYDPHLPYEPLPEWRGAAPLDPIVGERFADMTGVRTGDLKLTAAQREAVRALYAAEVRWVDSQVGRLMDGLRRAGRYDDAAIVFVSDHGEELWDHGGFEHGHTFHRELLHVPLAIKAPGWAAGGGVESLVETTAVTPTILSLLDSVDTFEPDKFSAEPLTADNGGAELPGPTGIVSEGLLYFDGGFAVTTDQWKWTTFDAAGRNDWFELQADRWERRGMTTVPSDIEERLRTVLERQRVRSEALRVHYGITEGARSGIDPHGRAHLHALGYIGEE